MLQPTQAQMQARAADIHERNAAAGWWTDLKTGESLKGKRSAIELLVLVHSEISEAMEGERKNLADDKLPHRAMYEVEIADTVIRVYDMIGGFDLTSIAGDEDSSLTRIFREKLEGRTRSEALGELHLLTSRAMIAFGRPAFGAERALALTMIVRGCYAVAAKFGLDLEGAIDEKLAYNRVRADHRPENRRLEVGKKF